jgi:hypothetical protein
MTQSLLNQPTPPYRGAANSLYGPRGPQRASPDYRAKHGPPQSIADNIDDAIKRVANLTPKQRLAVHNAMLTMTRDLSFVRMVAAQIRGPGPDELAVHGSDEGRPL